MRLLWTHRVIDAPAGIVWRLLTDVDAWPAWGPSVRAASLHGPRFEPGARGSVTPAAGPPLPFEIIEVENGRRWNWKVGGVTATDHVVEPVGPSRCRAGFGVPWPIAPYLAVCRVALRRLEAAAHGELAAR